MTPEMDAWIREQLAEAPPPSRAQLVLLQRLFGDEKQDTASSA